MENHAKNQKNGTENFMLKTEKFLEKLKNSVFYF